MRRTTKAAVAIVVGGLVAAGVAVVVPRAQAASADTFVASVPWSSAVVASTSARTFTVRGDVEGMDDRFPCGPVVKSKVSETSTTVTVRVEVFDRPLPLNVGCAGAGLVTVPATIHLKSPLGDRRLIDGANRDAHDPLVVDRTPALTSVPQPFVRRATGWDESTGQIGEWWRWQKHGQAQQINFDFGPTATASRPAPASANTKHVTIGRSAGAVSRETGGDTVTTTVTWSPSTGQTYRLIMLDQSSRPMSEAAVIALARSVR